LSDDELTFSVDSLLLSELGERLVTKNHVALAELIKNTYDADATEVKVVFKNAKVAPSKKSEIHIIDNGHGMTFEQVKEFWMRIATPNKLRNPISPRFGRKKTGDKGIGRFACHRLANNLVMESIARIENSDKLEYTKVEFDWKKFKPGQTLTEVPNVYETRHISKGISGLVLRLIGLRDSWTQRDFNVLRRQILGLSVVKGIRREGFEEDPGFDVFFDAPEFDMGVVRIAEQMMDAGWGRLRGLVSGDGTAVLKLDAMTIGHMEFELPDSFIKIPGVALDIAVIWRNKEYCRDPSIFTLGVIDEILSEYSGVRVYLDGFRVYPYGDQGDDWLDIDRDVARRHGKARDVFRRVSANLLGVDHSRAMLNHPRNQNLIGRVNLSNYPDKIFEVTMNREGFVENEAVKLLREFIRQALEWTTLHYNHFLYGKQQEEIGEEAEKLEETVAKFEGLPEEVTTKLEVMPVVSSALNVLEKSVKVATSEVEKLPPKARKELYQHAEKAKRVVEDSISYMERQISTLRAIASTGALLLTFIHEARTLIGRLDTHAAILERLAEKLDQKERKEFTQLANALRATRDRFDGQIGLFNVVSRDLTLTERRKVPIKQVFDEVVSCFEGLTERFDISVESEIPKTLRTDPVLESEVYSILINLISNAVKAVIASDDGHRIKVEALKGKGETVLRVYDDGIGLSEGSRDLAVMPLVADPEGRLYKRLKEKIGYEDLLVVGEGSGLGLSIVKDMVEYYGKRLQFIDVEKPWKTCVEVTLP